jgi:hypothetical protein
MTMRRHAKTTASAFLLAVLAGAMPTRPVWASGAGAQAAAQRGDPRARTLDQMSAVLSATFTEQPLREVVEYIAAQTGADVVAYWADDDAEGMDPELPITLRAEGTPALSLLERVLRMARAADPGGGGPAGDLTWQLGLGGELEVGPKSVLNENTRLAVYDIRDLIFVVPDFDDAPHIDLSQQNQQGGRGGGGGGGQGIFGGQGGGGGGQFDPEPAEERIEQLIRVIQTTVEPDAWVDQGGEGATVSVFQNSSLIVTAPDYVHRQLVGYSFWPSDLQRVTRRSVDGVVRQGVEVRARP